MNFVTNLSLLFLNFLSLPLEFKKAVLVSSLGPAMALTENSLLPVSDPEMTENIVLVTLHVPSTQTCPANEFCIC